MSESTDVAGGGSGNGIGQGRVPVLPRGLIVNIGWDPSPGYDVLEGAFGIAWRGR